MPLMEMMDSNQHLTSELRSDLAESPEIILAVWTPERLSLVSLGPLSGRTAARPSR